MNTQIFQEAVEETAKAAKKAVSESLQKLSLPERLLAVGLILVGLSAWCAYRENKTHQSDGKGTKKP